MNKTPIEKYLVNKWSALINQGWLIINRRLVSPCGKVTITAVGEFV